MEKLEDRYLELICARGVQVYIFRALILRTVEGVVPGEIPELQSGDRNAPLALPNLFDQNAPGLPSGQERHRHRDRISACAL